VDIYSDVRSISLCSGVAGLDLGVRLALPTARVVCYVEIEAFACQVLVSRMEEGILDAAPLWSNLKTFDGKPWRRKIHLITGGFPCQPFSQSGKKRGDKDPRHLWPDICRIIAEVQPEYCFFENVPGLLTTKSSDGRYALEVVRDDLQRMGYQVEAGLFSAEEVGAPHERKRVYILAHARRGEWEANHEPRGVVAKGSHGRWHKAHRWQANGGGLLADAGSGIVFQAQTGGANGENGGTLTVTGCDGKQQHSELPNSECARLEGEVGLCRSKIPDEGCRELGHSNRKGLEGRGCIGCECSDQRVTCRPSNPLATFPPSPDKVEEWAGVTSEYPHLAPALECPVRGVVDGTAYGLDKSTFTNHVDRLRAVGNGVVPLTAGFAFTVLHERLTHG
jgi:DNA (cytosine-5)-methyltransferase 1